MVRKLTAALALLTLAGAASAAVDIITRAPEIDPASAMAGLTLLVGGLAVLRGRRVKISAE